MPALRNPSESLTMDILIHPPLSAFPVPFLIVALATELIRRIVPTLREDATSRVLVRVMIFTAAASVAAAFFSGYHASEHANKTFAVSDDVIALHHLYGRLLLFLMFPLVSIAALAPSAKHGKRVLENILLILLLTVVAIAITTGYLGGRLVFVHGAGVEKQIVTPSPNSVSSGIGARESEK